MANALEMLSADHRKVEDLFTQFGDTGEEAVAAEICDELTVHTHVEESLVYPELRRLDAALEDEAEREHAEAKRLIERIRGATGDDLIRSVDELRQAVEHHVAEEEGKAFPRLRELGDEWLDDLGGAIQQAKKQAARA
jgi:hemerythrin superfamily protein